MTKLIKIKIFHDVNNEKVFKYKRIFLHAIESFELIENCENGKFSILRTISGQGYFVITNDIDVLIRNI